MPHGGRVNVSATQVTNGLKKTLEDWLHGFVAEQERLEGRDARELPVPGDVVIGSDAAIVRPEDDFPIIWVVSPGLSAEPMTHGLYSTTLQFGAVVGVFMIDEDREAIHDKLRSYVAALRFCLLHKGVDGLDCSVDFTDEAYDTVTGERNRSFAGGEVGLVITVELAVQLGEDPYPNEPPEDPYDPPADPLTVQTVNIDYEIDPIDQ